MKQCQSDYIVSYYGSYFKDNDLWVSYTLNVFVAMTVLMDPI